MVLGLLFGTTRLVQKRNLRSHSVLFRKFVGYAPIPSIVMKTHLLVLLAISLACSAASAQWKPSNSGLRTATDSNLSVRSIAQLGQLVLASTNRGLFRSSDNGNHWRGQHWGESNSYSRDMSENAMGEILVLRHPYTLSHPKWTWLSTARPWFYVNDSISGTAITVDAQGNAIVCARASGMVYVDDDTIDARTPSLVIMKYDPNGKILWIRTAATPKGNIYFTSVACDSQGTIYAAGLMQVFVGKTPVTATFGSTSISSSLGYATPFLASYDPTGKLRWVDAGIVTGNVGPLNVACDSAGNAYLAGTFGGDLTLNGGTVSTTIRRGPGSGQLIDGGDLFIAKYHSTDYPSVDWIVQSKSHGYHRQFSDYLNGVSCTGLCVDAAGQCYLLGTSVDTEFVAGQELTGMFQQFIAKYDTRGNGVWAVPFYEDEASHATEPWQSISCDRNGAIAISGTDLAGQITFNGKTFTTISQGYSNPAGILAAFDSSGVTRWFKAAASGTAPQLTVSGIGNIFVNTPVIYGSRTFDSVQVNFERNFQYEPTADYNAPITKLNADGSVVWAFADGSSGALAVCRDQSLRALSVPTLSGRYGPYRYGRLGVVGNYQPMAVAKLSANAPGVTIDTEIYLTGGSTQWGGSGLMSADHGKSWLSYFRGGSRICAIGNTIVVSGGYAASYRSTNFGAQWDTIRVATASLNADGNILHGSDGNGAGVYSLDTGKTWQTDRCRLGGEKEIMCGDRAIAIGGAISADTFKTWVSSSIGLGGATGTQLCDSCLALASFDNVLLDGSYGLSASTNSGESWSYVGDGALPNALCLCQLGDEVLVGSSFGVWRRPLSEIRSKIASPAPVFTSASQMHAYGDAAGQAVAIDSQGNAVVFGSFRGSVTIGDQTLTHTLIGKTDRDYYLVKYDSNGNTLWSLQLQNAGLSDTGLYPSIAIAPTGEIYVGGHFLDTLRVGSSRLIGNPYNPVTFLLKCSASGQVEWLNQIANPSSTTTLNRIAIDRSGDIVLVGNAARNTSIGSVALPDGRTDRGAFIAAAGSDGSIKWAKRIRLTRDNAVASTVAITSDNRLVAGGQCSNGIFFVTSTALFLDSYGADGSLIDTATAASSTFNTIASLGADASGNVYVEGALADSLSLGSATLRTKTPDARYLARFNHGVFDWAKVIGTHEVLQNNYTVAVPCQITTVSDGSTYVLGLDSVVGQSSFDRHQGTNYVAKFNTTGAPEWTKQTNHGYTCAPLAIAANNAGVIWTTGAILLGQGEYPHFAGGCNDMAFGLFGFALNKSDSNHHRPYTARLAGNVTSAPLAVLEPAHTVNSLKAMLYPNPMASAATLLLHVEQPQHLRVSILDPLGREMKLISSGEVAPGDIEQPFALPDMPNGQYYLLIRSQSGTTALSFVIQK